MLTADAFGVMPPIAQLTPKQALYYFLSGFTAKVAGTERGVVEPQPTFSTCFGAPFLPRRPAEYAALLPVAHRPAPCPLLAGQHRLDGRTVRRGKAQCRSSGRGRCSTPRSRAAFQRARSGPTGISASTSRLRSKGSPTRP